MKKLLHIEASPRGDNSFSSGASRRFLDALVAADGAVEIVTRHLWHQRLPDMDGALLAAKYIRLANGDLPEPERRAWAEVEALVAELADCDGLVISTPMWNFGIPYRLKHWIDLVTQPGLSFTFSPETGYAPLLADRPVAVFLASAGDYRYGPSRGRPDLATPYLREALAFLGLRDLDIVPIGATVPSQEAPAAVERASLASAALLSKWQAAPQRVVA